MALSVMVRRRLRAARTRVRELLGVVKGLASTRHPLLVHIIPTRRCNLACTYCNEYDDFSKPVDTAEMLHRVDLLAAMGTAVMTISGGEPLLHPDLDQIIARMRGHGILTGMITNGYLLTADRIARLNRAGLEYLQISIDNAMPDEVSMKSLKVLDQKLKLLAEHAVFQVNINSVLGSGVKNPEDALAVAHRAQQLGFTSTVGILHDDQGQLQPLGARETEIFEEIMAMGKRSFSRINGFPAARPCCNTSTTRRSAIFCRGRSPPPGSFSRCRGSMKTPPGCWCCRAGARYLYICEEGLVHWCSQQRGYPGIPLEKYSVADRLREYSTRKHCAPRCTISCVQQISIVDNWRDPQTLKPAAPPPPASSGPLVQLTGVGSQGRD